MTKYLDSNKEEVIRLNQFISGKEVKHIEVDGNNLVIYFTDLSYCDISHLGGLKIEVFHKPIQD